MTIIKTAPFTPADFAILEEKRSDVLTESLYKTFLLCFFLPIFSVLPGRHGRPSLYEDMGVHGLMLLEGLLVLGGICMYYIHNNRLQKDIKSGLKTIATVEIREKITGLEDYKVFTKEEETFKSFAVSKEIYHKVRKGNLITIEFAPCTKTIFDIKMPY
jgi:hypothetical protein